MRRPASRSRSWRAGRRRGAGLYRAVALAPARGRAARSRCIAAIPGHLSATPSSGVRRWAICSAARAWPASSCPGLLQGAGLDPAAAPGRIHRSSFRRIAGEPLPVEVHGPHQSPGAAGRCAGTGAEWTTERRAGLLDHRGGADRRSDRDARSTTLSTTAVPDALFDADDRIRLAWDLADVYAWSMDFNRDIQDRRPLRRAGRARSLRRGRSARRPGTGRGPAGLRQASQRLPLRGRRAGAPASSTKPAPRSGAHSSGRRSSSGGSPRRFTRSRFHPVLGIWRKHEGTDYAAGSGTPVMAAGDGSVLRAGRAGRVRQPGRDPPPQRHHHPVRPSARLRPGVRAGRRVSQGEVIGYVGSTGLASGAHLHYEFRVNGAARDSRRVDLGEGEPLEKGPAARALPSERARLAAACSGTAGAGRRNHCARSESLPPS